jgi:hypothetical protein
MAETLRPSYFKSVLTVVPAAARLLDRGWAQFQKTMKTLIKKSEIGLIKGFDPSYGWYLVKKHEAKNGPLKSYLVKSDVPAGTSGRRSAVAYKASDVAKILGVAAKYALNKVIELRSNSSSPTELTIYKPKK